MNWRERITEAYAQAGRRVKVDFRPGATAEQLAALETAVELRTPTPLRELLTESDGVVELLSRGDTSSVFYSPVWSCDEIIENNRRARAHSEGAQAPPGAPEAKPFYFADAGVEGILFAFIVRPVGPEDPGVYAYYPIEKGWRLVSSSLAEHLSGWEV